MKLDLLCVLVGLTIVPFTYTITPKFILDDKYTMRWVAFVVLFSMLGLLHIDEAVLDQQKLYLFSFCPL